MRDKKLSTDEKQITSVVNLGIAANIVLFIVKLIIGIMAGSIALVADGVHSLSDMTTDLVVLFGVRLGSKKTGQNSFLWPWKS